MAATVRQPKPTKKGFPGDNPSNRSVCSLSVLSSTFPVNRSIQPPGRLGRRRSFFSILLSRSQQCSPTQWSNPRHHCSDLVPSPRSFDTHSSPGSQSNSSDSCRSHRKYHLSSKGRMPMLTSQKGTTITILTKSTKQRYEGIIASTAENEGDTTGVTLRDVKELNAPNVPIKSQFFIASTNIDSWSPVATNSNSSGSTPPNTNSRADSKERVLLQLAGLTVRAVYQAHSHIGITLPLI
jgi:hypothetical protein